jgi:pyrimidine deaminase RibD-like protein
MEKFDHSYIEMASVWAKNSYCKRRQVGALLVKDRMIISDGYNGTPSGFENVCEDENGVTKPYVLHAEANAITKVAKSGNSSAGATLYVTASPAWSAPSSSSSPGSSVWCTGMSIVSRMASTCSARPASRWKKLTDNV